MASLVSASDAEIAAVTTRMPMTREEAVALLLECEERFRVRVAQMPDGIRERLAHGLAEYSRAVIAIDHTKGVALAELADLVTPSFTRTFS